LKLQVAGVSEVYEVVKLFDVLFCSVLGTTHKGRHLDTFEKYIQVDCCIRRFSIRGFSYLRLAAAWNKIWKIKEINGS